MQLNISLRDAIVATIVLSPAFISGLTLPWSFHNSLAARSSVLSGGIVDAFAHEIRANKNSDAVSRKSSDDDDDDDDDDNSEDVEMPTRTGAPTGGASGFPQPTGGFGVFGGGDGCGSGAQPSGTGSVKGQGVPMYKFNKAKRADTPPSMPSGAMPSSAPTGCGGFGAGPTGQARPTGGFGRQ